MKKKILRNWGLKLLSIVIAFMLWYFAVSTDNPKETRNFYNIPVILRNAELLEQENKVYEILGGNTTRVSVRAPRSVIEQLRASDIIAEADMNMLTDINTIAITCTVPNYEVESVTSNPAVLRLGIEDRSSKWVYVQAFATGDAAEGYMIGNITTDQNRIEISGPKSVVEKLSYASVHIDVSGATNTQSANAEIILHDAEGNTVESENLHKAVNYIYMQVEILPVKEIPVELEFTGVPAQRYLATGEVKCEPEVVAIAGNAYTLAGITKISIPASELDITGATGNVEKVINVRDYLPSIVRFEDPDFDGRVTATVYVEPLKERTLQIPEERINIYGIPENMTYSYALPGQAYRLTVSGLNAVVSALNVTDVSCSVNIEEWMEDEGIQKLTPGTYRIPVRVILPKDITAESEIYVRLEIEEEKEDGEIVRD